MKKTQDLKKTVQESSINLRADNSRKTDTRKLFQNKLSKQSTPVRKIQDLTTTRKDHYLYVKGKKFTPPRFLGNIIKIGFFGFVILILINTVNVYYISKKMEKDISAEAYEGYSFLIEGGKNTTKVQFEDALNSFQKALENFSTAESDLWFVSTDKTTYAKSNNLGHAINSLLTSGKHFAIAGEYFLNSVEEFNKIPLYFVSKNKNPDINNVFVTDAIKTGLKNVNLATNEITLAAKKINSIEEKSLPLEIKNRVFSAKKNISEISNVLNSTKEHFPALLKLLGDDHPHRYLILLQNNNEIRPAGGFIGSYAIMDVNEGYIEKLEIQDVYDVDGSFVGLIEPPEELKNFISNWRFRDSNYSYDFPTSAGKARWFLEKEGGPKVDTVIGINQGLLTDMLAITGPIQVGNFGKLDSGNYNLLLSYIIEGKIWGAEDPKHILKVFIPAFKEEILKEDHIGKVGSKVYKAIQQKHIMFYSSDFEVQALFDSLGVSGRVHETQENEDYLSVINFSIGGTKSDQFIEENISHDTLIDKSGNITNEVNIKRTHNWDDQIYYQWKKVLQKYGLNEMPDQLIDTLGRGRNKVYTKVYVPAGSILMESNGTDVETKYDKDLKKTYFLSTMEVKAGESKNLKIKYRLPFSLDLKDAGIYKLIIEKQPGSRGSLFNKTVHAGTGVENIDFFPSESRVDTEDTVTYSTNLVYDRYFSGIWSSR